MKINKCIWFKNKSNSFKLFKSLKKEITKIIKERININKHNNHTLDIQEIKSVNVDLKNNINNVVLKNFKKINLKNINESIQFTFVSSILL